MGLDLKKIKDNMEKKAQGGGIDRWKPTIGENYIRVVPHSLVYFTDSISTISFMYYAHFGVGPEGAQEMVVCPRSANKKNRCPVCEAAVLLRKGGNPSDQALANRLTGKRRHLINLIDLKNDTEIAKGIQIYECGGSVNDAIMQWCNEKWGDPIDLDSGRNLTLSMKVPGGDKMRTEYSITPDPTTSSIKDKLPANWKDQIKKLETIVPVSKTYDEIKKIMEGEVDYGTAATADAAPAHDAGVAGPAAQASAAVPVEKKPGAQPDCYGKLYSTRSHKCVDCTYNANCKVEFLK
jgi:hypothetical protein